MPLHLSLPGTRPADPALRQFDVMGPPGLPGKALADLLATDAPGIRWHAGNIPLSEVPALPSHGHLLLTPAAAGRPAPASPAPLWLLVEEGPDSGSAYPLPRGAHRIGRHNCDVTVADPTISRHHADLVVDGRSITLNWPGVHLRRASGPFLQLAVGDHFRLGSTTFRVAAQDQCPPSIEWPLPPLTVDGVSGSGRPALALLGAVLPLLIGAALVAATGSWLFLAFGAVGLATGGLPAAAELRARHRFRKRIRAAAEQDRARLESLAPALGTLVLGLSEAAGPPARNPERNPASGAGSLPLRVGRGEATANVSVAAGPAPPPVRLMACPVLVALRAGSVVAVTGAPAAAAAALRALVFRAAVAVHDAGWLLLLAGPASAFPASLRRHPQVARVRSPGDLARLPHGDTPAIVVLAGSSPQWLGPCQAAAGEQRIALLCLDPAGTLPAQWRISPDGGWLEERREPQMPERRRVEVDGMSFRTMDEACRATAAGGQEEVLPRVDPASRHLPGPRKVAWQDAATGVPGTASAVSSLVAHLGWREGEPGLQLDLVTDGPHLLVAGTTGSGKSELLKALLLELARSYPPTEVGFLLADFKGGSAFSAFRALPHTQALITDLDAETARRTLESLRAELVRRERLLREWGAADYAAYRGIPGPRVPGGPHPPVLPRLVAVVDEFRVLADDMPEALADLARLAAVGRSLGVHLVLATQRPQGCVPPDLRANLNTVVCLRVLAPTDSVDLLGTAAAAEIPVDAPGWGYARRGGESPARFRLLPPGAAAPEWSLVEVGPDLDTCGWPRRITVLPAGAAPAGAGSAETGSGRPDPVREAVAELARSLVSRDRPSSPFAPPLPEVLESIPRRFLPVVPAAAVPLGLADLVDEQCVRVFGWSPRSQRRIALVGGPSGGGAAFVRRLVEGAAGMEPECHVYVLDGALSCPEAAGLPRVAGYIDPSEPERVSGMLDVLEEGCGETGPGADRVLVLTGLAAWFAALGPAGMPRLEDRLAGLARAAGGPSIIVAGDRDVASSRFFALAEHRLYLPFGLGPETTMLWPRLRKVRRIPGRAVWTGPGLPDGGVAVQLLGPLPAGAPGSTPPARLPLAACRPLPRHLPGGDLLRDPRLAAAGPAAREARGGYLLGVTGPDNRPWTWQPGRVGLVLGRPGSGKTSVLRFLQASIGAPAAWIGPEDAPADRARGPEDRVPPVVLVDDAADLSAEQRARVEQWHRAGSRVVLAAAPGPRLFLDLPLAATARAAESVLVLNPRAPADADIVGWRVEPLARDLPGRGVVLVAGVQRQVHCAHP
ncbi:hypothetical protein NCCP1664_25040 [Zafaria cholistanensis]|uniref:FtsK domain-containing protein n=1 Tax=Zafaria cholistanensis TaxID=1682741 RepID=A0A5A7NTE4_9MICC|nr:FtsK/SpoIIIE domain-containing protein [Zafaria cholistanensis]GER24009.1 hypothetical protein NCCP1664_25040 [Zafaria cholistanensis]